MAMHLALLVLFDGPEAPCIRGSEKDTTASSQPADEGNFSHQCA